MSELYIGDTPEQLGTIQAADAIMIDGKIVTREDVRKMQSEIEAFKSLYSAAKGSADKLNEMLRGANEERNELAATVEALQHHINRTYKSYQLNTGNEPSLSVFHRAMDEAMCAADEYADKRVKDGE